ncbi:MAG: VOC family protein [Thermoplasmata archaeon]|nr:VOC family protein [Thermoplasmata archaeon]
MAKVKPTFFGPMLIVRDFAASLEFYREVIGLEGAGESPYAEFVANSCALVLLDHAFWKTVGGLGGPSPRVWKREGVVLALKVGNVDEEYQRIKSKGVAIASPPADRPMMGLRNFQVYDPDGNLVELTSPLQRK